MVENLYSYNYSSELIHRLNTETKPPTKVEKCSIFFDWSMPTLKVGLSRKFWSGGKIGPGDQNFWNIGPGGPFFPENFGPPV